MLLGGWGFIVFLLFGFDLRWVLWLYFMSVIGLWVCFVGLFW